ncbi:MAG TPA: bifunctional phosphoribosylaminoimidazolecarboxamide formyltransferase/IMP cyclohydrolase [Bryobacteraceae bacterium]|jgi:phosphoribosylaminoimidazolecarboxamide formyltransferase/IMP cyclohydrolase|nr:bifunctional phosphoribosylaminoimidazolecarboxamide formyltransferase/IMP cyclohydrolase [Bryobacteraceae bacterium]
MPDTLVTSLMRVLISVTDKAGVPEFARGLVELGADLISTGGTARLLRENGVPVRDVSEVTGFPEMLDGRVKTMHPKITGAILAVRENAQHAASLREHGIEPIDMVVVNLYQFEKIAAHPDASLEDLIENIDIGGPTMIRSAAKNWQDVAIVTSPSDYQSILDELRANGKLTLSRETKWKLAKQAFQTTARYDRAISARLAEVGNGAEVMPPVLDIRTPRRMSLRYGENPHQHAALYASGATGIAGAEQLHGKKLSYNNLVDLDACWQLVCEFSNPAAAIIKHTNPAGCAEDSSLVEAYRKALECDPISAYGGVIGLNRQIDEETAAGLARLFVEAIAAPAYSVAALNILQAKKNLRLIRVTPSNDAMVVRSISGGYVAQTPDRAVFDRATCEVKTKRAPTSEEWPALEFAWKVVKHVKSNAIVYARAGQTVAVGAGQMSRVDSVNIGAMKAQLPLEGTVVASDAYFPFADGLEQAVKNGATALIQPGGSVKDEEVIAAADRLGVAMVFTGVRHFRH